jgi:hypothetical protein
LKEECFSAADIDALLSSIDKADVLVGGQALAFWVGYYDIRFRLPARVPAITMDGDILGSRKSAQRIAADMGGRVTPAAKGAITILVAQVTIELGNERFLNVDIIDRVNGLTNSEVRKRALPVSRNGSSFLVMHPLDVFISRVRNILSIPAKQDEKGRLQLELGVRVARHFIEDVARKDPALAARAANIAFNEFRQCGKKILDRWDVDLFDAIPLEAINSPAFVENQRKRMIAAHGRLMSRRKEAGPR